MNVRRFAVLSTPRTGSNWLCSILDSHPQLCCHYELFNPARPFFAGSPPPESSDLKARRRDPLKWLDRVVAGSACLNAAAEAIGFKLHLDHRPSVLRYLLFASDLPLILVDRKDRLAQFASFELSQKTGAYTADDPERAPPSPIKFELEAFKRFVEREEGLRSMVRTLLQQTGEADRLFEIDYEDIGNTEDQQALFVFLGVNPSAEMTVRRCRAKTVPTAMRFADFEYVRKSLEQSVHLQRIQA